MYIYLFLQNRKNGGPYPTGPDVTEWSRTQGRGSALRPHKHDVPEVSSTEQEKDKERFTPDVTPLTSSKGKTNTDPESTVSFSVTTNPQFPFLPTGRQETCATIRH